MIKKILVIGAMGMIGKPVVRELVAAGYELSAFDINMKNAQSVLPPNVNLIHGDLQNISDLERAVEGQDAIYLNLSVKPNERETDVHSETDGIEKIITVAKDSNIQRLGYLSSLLQNYHDSAWWVLDIKRKAKKLVRESGIPYFIFYPSTFMETIPYLLTKGNFVCLAGKSKFPMYWIAAKDYGKQVSRAFGVDTKEDKEYVIQGPEPLLMEDAASRFAEAYDRKLFVVKLSMNLMRLFGQFSRTLDYGANISYSINNYPEAFQAGNTWQELGKPTTTIEQFARRNVVQR